MSGNPEPVSVKILGREYKLRCPPSEKATLIAAARHLDRQMRKVREQGQVIGTDRVLLMAALNITHELVLLQEKHRALQQRFCQRLGDLNRLIDETLSCEESS